MYLDSKDFQTVWNLAHNWTGYDPDATDPTALPQDVKESIHRIVGSILRGSIPARTKRRAIFIDDSLIVFLFDFLHYVRMLKCQHKDVFNKTYLNSLYVRRPNVLEWCEKEYLEPPPIWKLAGHSPFVTTNDESEDENQDWYENLTDLRKQRVTSLEVAKKLWKIQPNQTYEDVRNHPDMKRYGYPNIFTQNSFKKWARPFATDYAKNGGNRKETIS